MGRLDIHKELIAFRKTVVALSIIWEVSEEIIGGLQVSRIAVFVKKWAICKANRDFGII